MKRILVSRRFYSWLYNIAFWLLEKTYPNTFSLIEVDGVFYSCRPNWKDRGGFLVATLTATDFSECEGCGDIVEEPLSEDAGGNLLCEACVEICLEEDEEPLKDEA